MSSTRQQARAAGFLYLALALIAPIGLIYIPGKLLVPGNAAATVDNIRASATLLRIGIGSELIHQVIQVFLVMALYRLFKAVNETRAREMVILGALVSVPVVFLNVLNDVAALVLASGADFLSVFPRPQLDALAYFFFNLHTQGITVAAVFWGLWLFPFGILVISSGFIPRVFGWLLMIAGAAYVVSSFATLVIPQIAPPISRIASLLEIAEVPIVIWLVIWGARTRPANAAA